MIKLGLIKDNINFFMKPVTYLFNEYVVAEKFPEILKLGIITSVYKNGNKTDIVNYRSICILSTNAL